MVLVTEDYERITLLCSVRSKTYFYVILLYFIQSVAVAEVRYGGKCDEMKYKRKRRGL